MKTVAIHQPNFIPHQGYFAKIMYADIFVLFDTAQYTKGGWTNRNKLLLHGKPAWLSVPVELKGKGLQRVADVDIAYRKNWVHKFLVGIAQNYSQAAFKDEVLHVIEPHLRSNYGKLAELNSSLLQALCDYIGLATPLVLASQIEGIEENKNAEPSEHLLQLVQAMGGQRYLSGPSGKKYLKAEKFEGAGIALQYLEYEGQVYDQLREDFISGLSILDMLLWLGPRETHQKLAEAQA